MDLEDMLSDICEGCDVMLARIALWVADVADCVRRIFLPMDDAW